MILFEIIFQVVIRLAGALLRFRTWCQPLISSFRYDKHSEHVVVQEEKKVPSIL